ncbi:MAG: glutathione S-transferase [Lasallia pustulata]|uniref:Glutathione S-transferase n=1 Tax=Lasallia pustulata TaxID=136370 RepID=A0A5M8PKT4_9LECA|nr:MAG: glutathione S-transferase [Lasallia pustulata]
MYKVYSPLAVVLLASVIYMSMNSAPSRIQLLLHHLNPTTTRSPFIQAAFIPTASLMSSGSSITNWADKSGDFKRGQSAFRNFISKKPGAEFPPEKGRYHLYVSYACPWAHRTLIVRKLKGLEDIIPYTSVHWHMQEKGWRFATKDEKLPGDNVTPDPIHPDFTHLRDIYFKINPEYKGRFTVPTLYDVKQGKIVSNESSEIIRMFYTEFDDLLPEKSKNVNLLPEDLRQKIDEGNEWTYNDVNNGVYKTGFATTQEAYSRALHPLFTSLDRIETHLSNNCTPSTPFYHGAHITESDVRLYTTIIRFDAVYVQHFKCNVRDIRSGYPAIHRWLRNLYWNEPAFGHTTQFEHIKKHYTKSHPQINPHGITPVGPVPDVLPLDEEVRAAAAAVRSTNV